MKNPTLSIPVRSKAQLDQLFEAQSHLRRAGVTFDTGSDIEKGKAVSRDWELDYSLKGASIRNPKRKNIRKSQGIQSGGMIAIGLFVVSLLPIWRAAPDRKDMNFWDFIRYAGMEGVEHIEYEEAVEKARSAWILI